MVVTVSTVPSTALADKKATGPIWRLRRSSSKACWAARRPVTRSLRSRWRRVGFFLGERGGRAGACCSGAVCWVVMGRSPPVCMITTRNKWLQNNYNFIIHASRPCVKSFPGKMYVRAVIFVRRRASCRPRAKFTQKRPARPCNFLCKVIP